MVQANEPDAWTERFLLTIQPKGGTAVNYYAFISTYDVTGLDKDFTSIPNGKGGRIKNFTPQTEGEVTMEGYFTQVGNAEGVMDLINSGTPDAVQPLSVNTDHSRELYLLSIMHTTDESQTSAVDVTVQDERAERETYKNGHITMVTSSFTDNIKKFSIKYKVTPFAKDASSNVTYESSDGGATSILPAITYT
jgi:hypothetical protein